MAKMNDKKDHKVNTTWLKNAMKGIGASADQVISEIAPNLTEATKSASKIGNDLIKNVRQSRISSDKLSNEILNNKYMKTANSAFKNIVEDLKSGNLNNKERESEALFGEDDSTEISYGDIDSEDDGINVNVEQSSIQNGMRAMSEQSARNAIGQVKMQKATIDALVSVNSVSMQHMAGISGEIINHLNNINNSLSSMIEFQNNNMTKFMEASMAYYERIGSKTDNKSNDSYGSSSSMSPSDVFGTNGGININRYKEYVKSQFTKMKDDSTAGAILSMFDDQTLKVAAANPLGLITTSLTKSMMPKIITSTLDSMEKSMNVFMPELLSRIGDMANDETKGIVGAIKRTVGKTMGIQRSKVENFEKIKIGRGPIPFDGETKFAITDLITKDLREQTEYLKIIASHYDENSEATVNEKAKMWNYHKGEYVTKNEIDSTITKELVNSIKTAFTDTAFGSIMMNASNEIVKGSNDNAKVKRDREEFDNTVTELFTLIERSEKTIDLGVLLNLVQKTGASDNTKKLLKRYIENKYLTNSTEMRSVNIGRQNANKALSDIRDEIQNNPSTYNLQYSSYINGNMNEIIDNMNKWGEANKDSRVQTKRRRYGKIKPQSSAESDNSNMSWSNKIEKTFSNINPDDVIKTGKDYVKRKAGYTIGRLKAQMNGDFKGYFMLMVQETADKFSRIATRAKKFFFGDKDQEGNYKKGILSDIANELKDGFTKAGKEIKNGAMKAIFGKAKNEETGKWEDTDGHSIFGDIKDTLIKGGDTFKRFLYGDGTGGNIGLINGVKSAWNRNFTGSSSNTQETNEVQKSGNTAIASMTATGGLMGALLGGPIIGAVSGLCVGIASKGKSFTEILFGKDDDLDLGDGRKVKRQGLFGRIANTITTTIISPMRTELKYVRDASLNVIEHKILAPFAFAAEYVSENAAKLASKVTDAVGSGVSSVVDAIKTDILFPISDTIGKALTTATDLVFTRVKAIVSLPGNLIMATIRGLKLRERINELLPVRAVKFFFKEVRHLIFSGIKGLFKSTFKVISKTITAPFKLLGWIGKKVNDSFIGSFAKKVIGKINGSEWAKGFRQRVSEGYVGTLLERMKLNDVDFKERNKEIKKQKAINKEHDKNARIIARASKGEFNSDTEEARTWLKYNNPRLYKKLTGDSITVQENGRSTIGMRPEDIDNASLRDLSPEGQQVKLLQNIQNALNKWFNRHSDSSDADYTNGEVTLEDNMGEDSQSDSEEQGLSNREKRQKKRELNKKYKTVHSMNGDYKINKESGNIYLNGEKVAYEEAPLRVRTMADHIKGVSATDSIKSIKESIFKRFRRNNDNTDEMVSEAEQATGETVERHGIGGILKSGLSLVGEKGAELVHKAKDGTVSVLSNASTRMAAALSKHTGNSLLSNFNTNEKQNNELKNEREESQKTAEDNATTAEEKQKQMQDERDEKEKEEEKRERKKSNGVVTSIKNKLDSVFTPKNLIIAGAILLGKQIGKGLQWVAKTAIPWVKNTAIPFVRDTVFPAIKSAIKTISTVASGIFDIVKDIAAFFGIGKGNDAKGRDSKSDGGKKQAEKVATVKGAASAVKIAGSGKTITQNFVDKVALKEAKYQEKIAKTSGKRIKGGPIKRLVTFGKNMINKARSAGRNAIIHASDKNAIKEVIDKGVFDHSDDIYDYYKVGKQNIRVKRDSKIYNELLDKATDPNKKKSLASRVGTKIKSAASNAKEKLSNAIKNLGDATKSKGGDLINSAKNAITSSSIYKKGSSLLNSVKSSASNAASKAKEGTSSIFSSLGNKLSSGFNKFKKAVSGTKVSKGIKKSFGKIASTNEAKAAKELLSSGSNKLSSAAKAFINKVASVIEKFSKLIKSAIEKSTGRKLGKSTATSGIKKTITGLLEKLPNSKVDELINKFTTRTATRTSADTTLAAATAGLSKVAEVAVFALDGVDGAAALFHVSKDKVDDNMKKVGAAFGAVNASLAAAVAIIVAELIADYCDFSIMKEIAMWAYGLLTNESKEAMALLEEAQKELEKNYGDYEDNMIRAKYNELKKNGELPTGMNFDDYKKKVILENPKGSSGDSKYQVDYTSKEGYNDKANETKLTKVFGGIGNRISNAFKVTKAHLTGDDAAYKAATKAMSDKAKSDAEIKKTSGYKSDFIDTTKNAIDSTVNYLGEGFSIIGNGVKGLFGFGKGGPDKYNSTVTDYLAKIYSNLSEADFGKGGKDDSYDIVNGKPYYSQKDNRWSSEQFNGNENMGLSGCGPTALAMAVNDIRNSSNITPSQMSKLAKMTGNVDPELGTNSGFIEDGADLLGISTDRYINPDVNTLSEQIESGKPTILLGRGDKSSPFTSSGHYVVATGKKGNKISINDPRGKSYSKDYKIDDVINNIDSSWSLDGHGGRGLFTDAANGLKKAASAVGDGVKAVANTGKKLVTKGANAVKNGVKTVANAGKNLVTKGANAVKSGVKSLANKGKEILNNAPSFIKDGVKAVANAGKKLVKSVKNVGKNIAKTVSKATSSKKSTSKKSSSTTSSTSSSSSTSSESVSPDAISAQAVIDEALSHKGYTGNSNYGTKFGTLMNKVYGHPSAAYWCATFVVYCFYKASGEDKEKTSKALHNATTAGCAANVSAFKNANKWRKSGEKPKPGDVIFYTFSHTGIVEKADDNYVYTIEGNTSIDSGTSARSANGVWTKKKRINDSSILGYGITDTGEGTGSSSSSSSTTTTTKNRNFLERIVDYFSDFSSEYGSRLLSGNYKNYKKSYSDILKAAKTDETITTETSSSSSSSSSSSKSYSSNGNMSTESIAKRLYTALHESGVPNNNIAGMLGNFETETTYIDPTKIECISGEAFDINGSKHKEAMKDLDNWTNNVVFPIYNRDGVSYTASHYKASDGKYYPGMGLAQWTGSGAYDLIRKSPNGEWWNLDYQCDRILNSKPPTSSSYFGSGLKDWKKDEGSPTNAAITFTKYFEGNTINGQDERVTYANKWASKISNWSSGKGGADHNIHYVNDGKSDVVDSHMNDISSGILSSIKNDASNVNVGNINYNTDVTHVDNTKLLESIITVLKDIANNTGTSSSKLDYLKNITPYQDNRTIVVPNKNTRSTTNTSSNQSSYTTFDDIAAKQIARAGI